MPVNAGIHLRVQAPCFRNGGQRLPLPPGLLAAVAHPDGSRIASVVGAGCSIEAPTSLQNSRDLAVEVAGSCDTTAFLQPILATRRLYSV